jgi:hypothetical protein
MKRKLLILCGCALALAGAEWIRESFAVRNVDLRVVDGAAVGRLDAAMWRSYYERRPVVLFSQLMDTLGSQFGLPPLKRLLNAYRAAHAAFVFKDGRSTADYEKALPDLEAYYADIAAQATVSFDAKLAAKQELEWWILHREHSPKLADSLEELASTIYGIPRERFVEHAALRVKAMAIRDQKGAVITDADWDEINRLLERSWISLAASVKQ